MGGNPYCAIQRIPLPVPGTHCFTLTLAYPFLPILPRPQVRLAKHVAVGCMNDVVHAYQPTGHKSWSLYLPAHILAMQRMEVVGQRMTKALIVALANGGCGGVPVFLVGSAWHSCTPYRWACTAPCVS